MKTRKGAAAIGFGRHLADAIAAKGWTDDAVARKSRVSPGALSHYLAGARAPRIDVAGRIASALGVQLEYLASGEGPMNADAVGYWDRPLHHVDGLWSDYLNRPGTQRDLAKGPFKERFLKRYPGFDSLADTVRQLFGNLFARVMHAASKVGDVGNRVPNAAWRADVAGRVFKRCYEKAGVSAFNKEPATTRKWLAAIVAEMVEWENGRCVPAFTWPSVPAD